MPFDIPDKGTGQNDLQSILFSEYLDILVAGISGVDCVLAGCDVTAQGSPDMTCAVSKGAVLSNGVLLPVTAGNVTITAADGTNPRLDLVVVNSAGTKAARAGTPAAAPKPPTRSANDVCLAVVYVPAADTTISTAQIVGMRILRTTGPIVIHRQSTVVAVNTSTAAVHYLNNAASGLVIPNGLFLAGRQLRVRIWGNWLINSGTPTLALVISYGGTTMFADTSAATTADGDRRPFLIEFDVVAQANNDQAVIGKISNADVFAAITAPTTGIGEAWSPVTTGQESESVIGGSAAVDSDAADRTLLVTVAMNVSNAADEHVIEGATVELI